FRRVLFRSMSIVPPYPAPGQATNCKTWHYRIGSNATPAIGKSPFHAGLRDHVSLQRGHKCQSRVQAKNKAVEAFVSRLPTAYVRIAVSDYRITDVREPGSPPLVFAYPA